MSSSSLRWISGYHSGFFWSGLALSFACFALVATGNSRLVYPVEHTVLPLSWAFGGAAIVQFLAAELCHHAHTVARRAKEASERPAPVQPVVVRQPVHFVVLR